MKQDSLFQTEAEVQGDFRWDDSQSYQITSVLFFTTNVHWSFLETVCSLESVQEEFYYYYFRLNRTASLDLYYINQEWGLTPLCMEASTLF